MKKTCIIHIGMPKTGSSSIQNNLSTNLNDRNILYLPFDNPNHGMHICTLFGGKSQINRFHLSRGKSYSDIERYQAHTKYILEKSFASDRYTTYIISGEAIQTISQLHLKEMKKYLLNYVDEIKIIAYVREPFSYITSAFQQLLKHPTKNLTIEQAYPHYRKKLHKFDIVFGRENVYLWKFDPKYLYQGDVVLDFCKRLNIQIDKTKIKKVNESLSKEAIQLLYIYRKFYEKNKQGKKSYNQQMIERISLIGKEKFRLSPSLVNPILKINQEDIQWMEIRLGKTLITNVENKSYDVSSINELLTVNQNTIKQLKDIIPSSQFQQKKNSTIVELIELLHYKEKTNSIQKRKIMEKTIPALAQQIKENNPKHFNSVDETIIRKIIVDLFKYINKDIEETQEPLVKVPGLGKFRIKEINKDGENIKKIFFKPIVERTKIKEITKIVD